MFTFNDLNDLITFLEVEAKSEKNDTLDFEEADRKKFEENVNKFVEIIFYVYNTLKKKGFSSEEALSLIHMLGGKN